MTRLNIIKTAEKNPVTVDNIRLMFENVEYLVRYHYNTIFTYFTNKVFPLSVSDDIQFPKLIKPKNTTKLKFVIIAKATSAITNLTCDFTPKNGESYELEFGSIGTTDTRAEATLELTDTELGYNKNQAFDSYLNNFSDTALELYAISIFAEYNETNMLNIFDPQIGEKAKEDPFLQLSSSLLYLHKMKHIAGFLGEEKIQEGTTNNDYFIFHVYDYLDGNLSDQKKYMMDGILEALHGVSASNYSYYLYQENYGNTNNKLVEALRALEDGEFVRLNNNYIENDSYKVSSPYSSIQGYFATDNVNIFLRGAALKCYDDYIDARRQSSTYNSLVDSRYFEVEQGEYIDYEKINAYGRAFFNHFYKRAGNIIGSFYPNSQSISLTTSYVEKYVFPIFIKNHWAVDRYNKNLFQTEFCLLIKSNNSFAVTIDIDIITDGGTVTLGPYTFGFAETKYINEKIVLTKNVPSDEFMNATIEMKSSLNVSNIEIYSIVFSPMLVSETY